MQAEYATSYGSIARQHWWWLSRNSVVENTLERMAKDRPNGQFDAILDVGCGDAINLDVLSKFGSVEGLEPDATTLSPATLERWRIHSQPFDEDFDPGRQYDLITLLDVLEHIEEQEMALARAAEILSPQGVLLLTVPAFQALWTSHDDLNLHFRRYTQKTLTQALRGWQICSMHYMFHSLAAMKTLVVAKERLFGAENSPPSVPKPWVNSALRGICSLEARLVTPLRPPFGSSLLAVARPKPAD